MIGGRTSEAIEILARWLRQTAVTFSLRVLSVTDWLGTQLHISSQWASRAGFLVLLGFGMTLIQVDEYFLALILLILSGIVLLSKAIHWQGTISKPRLTQGSRILGMMLAILFIPVSVIWTQAKRGEKPWTAFRWPIRRIVTKMESKEPQNSPTVKPEIPVAPPKEETPTNSFARLDALFVGPSALSIIAKNTSKEVTARDPKYLVSFWNLDEANATEGLPIFRSLDSGDFIKPGQFGFGPTNVFDFAGPKAPYTVGRIKRGDRLFGFATVTCSNCVTFRCYWIYYVHGIEGWYALRPDATEIACMRSYDAMRRKVSAEIEELMKAVPSRMRHPIKDRIE